MACDDFTRRYQYEEDVPSNSDQLKLEILASAAEHVIKRGGWDTDYNYPRMALRIAGKTMEYAYWFARHATELSRGEPDDADDLFKNDARALLRAYEILFADRVKKSEVQILVLEDLDVLAHVLEKHREEWDTERRESLWYDSGAGTFEENFGHEVLHIFLRQTVQETAVERLEKGPLESDDPALVAEAYEAVLAWKRGRGRPPKGKLGQFEAANRMLKHAGLEAASAEALKAIWQSRPIKRRGAKLANSK